MRIALTMDDGPSEWTEPILDLLAEHQAKATFFVCGAAIVQNPSEGVRLLDRIHNEGHELGNHTTNHPNLLTLTPEQVRAEIAETQAMIHAVTGTMPELWRAPFLSLPDPLPEWPVHMGCDVIPGDWVEGNPLVLAERVVDGLQDGAVVLLHDGRPPGQPSFAEGGSLDTRQSTVDALKLILEHSELVDYVTASDLITARTL